MSKSHSNAKSSHYDKESLSYDAFNESNSKPLNQLIECILREHQAKTILDLTCGTGSQVFWLSEHGYEVIGADINAKMLKIARAKAKQKKVSLKFLKGDMRTLKVGEFDAVLTIFNAIGHLTKQGFEEAIQNIHRNLKPGGLYLFDIFNLSHLLDGNNITNLTIDWQKVVDGKKIREIQYSTITDEGILESHDIYYNPKISKSSQTLQVYTSRQLKDMLQRNGFTILQQCAIDGSPFIENSSERILTLAKKM